jgi:hypothetical protein
MSGELLEIVFHVGAFSATPIEETRIMAADKGIRATMAGFTPYPPFELTDQQKENCLAVMRDALNLLGSARPTLSVDQMIQVIAREYRHAATGETAAELGEAADAKYGATPSGELRDAGYGPPSTCWRGDYRFSTGSSTTKSSRNLKRRLHDDATY